MNMEKVTFTKRREAVRGMGRGPDNTYTPGRYTVLVDGIEVGYIQGAQRRYMEAASWRFYRIYADRLPGLASTEGPSQDTLGEMKDKLRVRFADFSGPNLYPVD